MNQVSQGTVSIGTSASASILPISVSEFSCLYFQEILALKILQMVSQAYLLLHPCWRQVAQGITSHPLEPPEEMWKDLKATVNDQCNLPSPRSHSTSQGVAPGSDVHAWLPF